MNELAAQIGAVLVAFFSGTAFVTFLKYLANKGRIRAETDEVASAGWRRYSDKLEKRLDELDKRLEKKDLQLGAERAAHELEMKTLMMEHEDKLKNIVSSHNIEKSQLTTQIETLEKRVDALEAENDRLKALVPQNLTIDGGPAA